MESFGNKVIVVTGGGSGIGFGIASVLASRGARVVLAGRRRETLTAAAEQLTAAGFSAATAQVDVRNSEAVERMLDQVTAELGGVDGLVNNAAGNFVCPAEELSANGWRAVVDIVLNGTWNCTSAVAKRMIAAGGGGAVLNIVASYAWTGHPGTVHSAAAKAGVVAMTRTLAVEWARYGIRLNCLCPGPTDTDGAGAALWASGAERERVTDSVPMRRLATTTEIADIASFLLSDRAAYVTGEVLVADGGQWLGKQVYGPPVVPVATDVEPALT